jgi:tRNA threonylcarbamoyl adenosine modification protein (Sua5/YciO/YrdC/YwlC family)
MGATIFRGGISGRMIKAAVSALRRGELIIYPTDTLYGIGCDLKNSRALEKLNRLKQRPRNKPFSFICESLSDVSEYGLISDTAFRVIRHLLPGPYTFILPMKSSAPRKMMNAEHALGIRVPDHPVPLEIVRNFGGPITTTSVNVATEEPLCAIGDLAPEFISAVGVIIDHGPLENMPSTVVDFTGDIPRLVRRGKGLEELKPYIDFVEEE